jgi:hypothetical protein
MTQYQDYSALPIIIAILTVHVWRKIATMMMNALTIKLVSKALTHVKLLPAQIIKPAQKLSFVTLRMNNACYARMTQSVRLHKQKVGGATLILEHAMILKLYVQELIIQLVKQPPILPTAALMEYVEFKNAILIQNAQLCFVILTMVFANYVRHKMNARLLNNLPGGAIQLLEHVTIQIANAKGKTILLVKRQMTSHTPVRRVCAPNKLVLKVQNVILTSVIPITTIV